MADRDRPAERVEPFRIRAGLGEPGERHWRECLVHLERPYVIDAQVPIGARTASTITASRMATSSPRSSSGYPAHR
jgi:hypothetical protein